MVVYHCQQSTTRLETIKSLEQEKSRLQAEKKKLHTEKERFKKEANDCAGEKNKVKEELRLKTEAFETLNTAMERLKVDHDKDVEAAKEAAKADLIKDYWGRVVKFYWIGFHDGGKEGPYERYFESLEDYDAKANTNFVLPPFPGIERDADGEELVNPEGG